jgi:hypothetical protein
MKSLVSTVAFLALASMANVAHSAGGLIQKLPKDGEWVTYYFEMKSMAQQQAQTMTGTFTVKSVGSVMENGEKCRWIEIEMKGVEEGGEAGEGKKKMHLTKVLVRENDFAPGSKTAGKILRGWKKDSAKAELKELSEFDKKGNGSAGMLFGGNRKDVKVLKKEKVIDYQKGQLKVAQGTIGKLDVKFADNAPKGIKYEVSQSVWPHKKVPFGTAAMELRMKVSFMGMTAMDMKMTFSFQGNGTGAKSVLPDKK